MLLGGVKREYCASRNETRRAIKNLLKIRRDFMAARGLHDAHPARGAASQLDGLTGGASQPADHRYLFTPEDRRQVMQDWKDRFHAMRDQVEQQKRDSWKPTGPPTDAQDLWGPNAKAVRSGKHSRFARHLQIAAGSKTMAELFIYTGGVVPEVAGRSHLEAIGGVIDRALDEAGQCCFRSRVSCIVLPHRQVRLRLLHALAVK